METKLIEFRKPIDGNLPPRECLIAIIARLKEIGETSLSLVETVLELLDTNISDGNAIHHALAQKLKAEILRKTPEWCYLTNHNEFYKLSTALTSFIPCPLPSKGNQSVSNRNKYSDTGDILAKVCRERKIHLNKPKGVLSSYYGRRNHNGGYNCGLISLSPSISLQEAILLINAEIHYQQSENTVDADKDAGKFWSATHPTYGTIVVKADDKVTAFEKLRTLGISSVKSLVEGLPGAKNKGRHTFPHKRSLAGFLALILSITILAIYSIVTRVPNTADPDAGRKNAAIISVKNTSTKLAQDSINKDRDLNDCSTEHDYPMQEEVFTNVSTLVSEVPPPRRAFTNAADQVLALALDIRPGMDMPPLPPGAVAGTTKEQLRQMFSTDITIEEDDSEQVRELKQRVKSAREEMLARLDAGGSFDDVLAEHRKMVNENAAVYRQCEEELRNIIAEGDEDGALQYRETMNKALNQMGIDSLMVPVTEGEREELKELRKERHRIKIQNREANKQRSRR